MSPEKRMFIVSAYVDIGSPTLGVINKGKRNRDINLRFSRYQIGKIEEFSFPLLVEAFYDFGIRMSLAVRDQLTEVAGRA